MRTWEHVYECLVVVAGWPVYRFRDGNSLMRYSYTQCCPTLIAKLWPSLPLQAISAKVLGLITAMRYIHGSDEFEEL
jgi:hypothetical protein